MTLRGLALVDVDADGKTHVDTPQRIVGASAAAGALFGLLSACCSSSRAWSCLAAQSAR